MKLCSKSSTLKFTPGSKPVTLIFFLIVPVLLFLLSLSVGPSGLTVSDAWTWIFGGQRGTSIHNIMMYVRLPRSISAAVCGASLAVAGLLLQSALNNSLASAGTIGVNSGAGLFAVTASIAFPGVLMAKPALAFTGAMTAALLVFAIADKAGASRSTIIMTGVALSSLLSAFTDMVVTIHPDSLTNKNTFFIGGFAHATITPVLYTLPFIILGFLGAILLSARLNVLSLGDEVAASLGLSVRLCRYLAMMCAAMLAASAVCIGGLLGFVGLIVPHGARFIAGRDHKTLVPFTAVCGASLVMGCDILARMLFKPYELPVGILLSALGAPFFLFLIIRGKRRYTP